MEESCERRKVRGYFILGIFLWEKIYLYVKMYLFKLSRGLVVIY